MNFNDLMARMRELDQPVAEGQIEECGDMPSMSPMGMPHEDPKPSMSLNLNAQGLDNIAELMKLMTKVNPDMINQKDTAIPTSIPTSNEPEIEIIPMDKPMAKPMGAPPMPPPPPPPMPPRPPMGGPAGGAPTDPALLAAVAGGRGPMGGGMPPMGGGMPMARKSGGRAMGRTEHIIDHAAGGGLGRLEKIKAYGHKA